MGNLIATYGDGHERQVADVHRQRHEPAGLHHAQSLQRRRGRRRQIRSARRMRDGQGRERAEGQSRRHAARDGDRRSRARCRSPASSSSPAASRARPASTTPSRAWSRAPACAPTWRCSAARDSRSRSATAAASTCSATVKGSPCHSARPWDGANAITGAMEAIRRLLEQDQARQEPSAARQADAHRQSHPEFSEFHPHGAGARRVPARPAAASGRRPERGVRRAGADRQGGRAVQGPGQRQGLCASR